MFTFRVYVHKANTSSSKSKQKPKHGKGNMKTRYMCFVFKRNELTIRIQYNVGHYQTEYFVLVILENSGVCNM